MNVLQAPTGLHEFDGEPIEQRGMRGRFPVESKVGDAGHERCAEVAFPNVIDGDASGQRVVFVRQPPRECEPSAGAGLWIRWTQRRVSRVLFRRVGLRCFNSGTSGRELGFGGLDRLIGFGRSAKLAANSCNCDTLSSICCRSWCLDCNC